MKTKLTIISLISVGALGLAVSDEPDKGRVATQHVLTLQGAKLAGEAAAKHAKENGAAPSASFV